MSNFVRRPVRPATQPAFIGQPTSRADLLPWAAQYNYPALEFTGGKPVKLHPVPGLPDAIQPMKYAIGLNGCKDNKVFWETAVNLGNEDMIDGLLLHIKSLSKEWLEAMEKPKTAMARERGIRIV